MIFVSSGKLLATDNNQQKLFVLKYILCAGGYSSVPDDYPLVLGCEEHVSSLGVFVA